MLRQLDTIRNVRDVGTVIQWSDADNNMELTPEQKKRVDELVAQGWTRDAAVLLVLESTEDVIDELTTDDADNGDATP